MERITQLTLSCVGLLLLTTQNLPAPIQEPNTPTPEPKQSVEPKEKKAVKIKRDSKNPEDSAKRKTLVSRSQATASQNLFVGTWRGIINIGLQGDVDLSITLTETGTILTHPHFGDWRRTLVGTSNGHTMTWKTTQIQVWTLTPNADGQTAVVTGNDPGAVLGIAAFSSSAVFRKTSQ